MSLMKYGGEIRKSNKNSILNITSNERSESNKTNNRINHTKNKQASKLDNLIESKASRIKFIQSTSYLNLNLNTKPN